MLSPSLLPLIITREMTTGVLSLSKIISLLHQLVNEDRCHELKRGLHIRSELPHG